MKTLWGWGGGGGGGGGDDDNNNNNLLKNVTLTHSEITGYC